MDSVHFSAGAPPTAGTHAVITRVDGLRHIDIFETVGEAIV